MYTINYCGAEYGPFHIKEFAERCMKDNGIYGIIKKCASYRLPRYTVLHEYNLLKLSSK